MLEEVMGYIHNYFEYRKVRGHFVVASGNLDTSLLLDGQYFKIVGSVFNDGVWQYPETTLTDEEFDGEVWLLAVPKKVTDLVAEIQDWVNANQETLLSPYQSESFGGYSYTKGASADGKSVVGWREVFGSKLDQWRKLA